MKEIQFIEVNESNEKLVTQLSVSIDQCEYIETISQCLDESKVDSYGIKWHPLMIMDDNLAIGFAMVGMGEGNRVWLDRFMIDQHYQGKGYGKLVLPLLINKIKEDFMVDTVFLSVKKENRVAIALYKTLGFVFIDELDGFDPVMQLI